MTEIIEDVKEAIDGEYQFEPRQTKLFRSLQACADFVISFGIRNYAIQDGQTQDGQYVVQVSYQRNQ